LARGGNNDDHNLRASCTLQRMEGRLHGRGS
jgi:hypothetical protein